MIFTKCSWFTFLTVSNNIPRWLQRVQCVLWLCSSSLRLHWTKTHDIDVDRDGFLVLACLFVSIMIKVCVAGLCWCNFLQQKNFEFSPPLNIVIIQYFQLVFIASTSDLLCVPSFHAIKPKTVCRPDCHLPCKLHNEYWIATCCIVCESNTFDCQKYIRRVCAQATTAIL